MVLALEVQAEEVAMEVQEVDMEVQEWEAQEVDIWLELAVEREMVAALRKGRIVPLAASAAEAAAQAVGLFRM